MPRSSLSRRRSSSPSGSRRFCTVISTISLDGGRARSGSGLLKPYDRERFDRALQRARDALASHATEPAAHVAELIARLRGETFARRLLIAGDDRSFYVAVRDVMRLEADGNNVVVHTRRDAHAMRATLESFESRLDPAQFARVHRSHVVNIDEIAEIRPWFHGDAKIVLRDGTALPWSRRYAARRPDLLR